MLIYNNPTPHPHYPSGVQGEALWEEVCVVPDRLVCRQLVQDQRPSYQLYSGEHDGGCGGTRDHRDRHAESGDCSWRLQHGGNTRNTVVSHPLPD